MSVACQHPSWRFPAPYCSYVTRKLNSEAAGLTLDEEQEVKAAKEAAAAAGVVFGDDSVPAARKTEAGNGDDRYSYRLGPMARQTIGPSVLLGTIETVMGASYDKEQIAGSLGLEFALHDVLLKKSAIISHYDEKKKAAEKERRAKFGDTDEADESGAASGGAGAGAGAGAGDGAGSSGSGRRGRGRSGKASADATDR